MRFGSKFCIAATGFLILSLTGFCIQAVAQNPEQQLIKNQPKGEPIEMFLKPDGRFDLEEAQRDGFVGPLDFSDQKVYLNARTNGSEISPNNITDLADDVYWSDKFKSSGLDGSVYASTVYNGDLIAGGYFLCADGVRVNYIAKWNGSGWTQLGSGVDGPVLALTVFNGLLIVAGEFYRAGGVYCYNIAAWNGTSWSALGTGMNYGVRALATYSNNLIAGGDFTTAGGVTVNHIGKWDGSSWSALGSGVGGNYPTVFALSTYNNNLIAGGPFTTAGGNTVNCIARWNGSSWSSLGSGLHGDLLGAEAHTLGVYNGSLIVGGIFATAGSVTVNNIARWSGSAWYSLGAGVEGDWSPVNSIAVFNNDLIMGGSFERVGGIQAKNIAKWDGSNWSSIDEGINGAVQVFANYNNYLAVGGSFSSISGFPINSIAEWDGSIWNGLATINGVGLFGIPSAFAVYDNSLIAAGGFDFAGNVNVNSIAKWNGISWEPLGAGVDGSISALTISDNMLVAGGQFTSAGGIPANNIAVWNGANWIPLGAGLDGAVIALACYRNEIIAAGDFLFAGQISVNHIAAWDGSSWHSLGLGINGSVRSLTIYFDKLIIGGNFTTAGEIAANNIASWDGSSWNALGSGTNNYVLALTEYENSLVAGGSFTLAGGTTVHQIAKWNGTSWSTLGSGIYATYPSVWALCNYNGHLIAGGNFTSAGGVSAFRIAQWDGSSWSALGSGVADAENNYCEVSSLVAFGNRLYASGKFMLAGGKASSRIASWNNMKYEMHFARTFDSTSIGGQTKFIVLFSNWDSTTIDFSLSLSNLDNSWYNMSCTNFSLLSGQALEDTIFINIPPQIGILGNYPFNINAFSNKIDSTITRSATLRVVNNPIILSVSPPDGMRTSSRDVNFSWYTSAICSTEVYIKPSDSSSYAVYSGTPERNHAITITALARNRSYNWYVRSAGEWGGVSTSPVRHFIIENGIVFTQASYSASVAKDYNQRFAVGITNTDSISHTVLLEADSNYTDIAINFVGDGSLDNLLLLNPNQTGACTLAVHTQDAVLNDYVVPLKLTSVNGADTIVDYSVANIHVNIPVINGTFEEVNVDSGTLAKNYRFTNLGDPITDLNITADDSLDPRIYFEPQISHGYLPNGQSVEFKAIPVLSPADTNRILIMKAKGEQIRFPSEELATISGTVTANFMGTSIVRDATFAPPEGESIFLGHVDGAYRCFHKRDWYCTNRPNLHIPWRIPPMAAPNQAFYQIDLTPSSGWNQRPHSVFISVNGHSIGSIENVIPNGTYSFVVDPSYLNFSPSQVSINYVDIHTVHMNGGHYVVAANMSICACLDALEGYISAIDQNQANQRIATLAGITPPAADIGVTISSPADGANINLGQPTTISATVTADGQPGLNYPVTATFNNGDQNLAMFDDGRHNDGAGGDGVYAGEWRPGHQGTCLAIVRAGNCSIFGQDNVNVNVVGPSQMTITVESPSPGFNLIMGSATNLIATVRDNFGNVVRGMSLIDHCVHVSFDCQPDDPMCLLDVGNPGDPGWEDGTYSGYWTPNPATPGPCRLTFSASSTTLGSAQTVVNGNILPPLPNLKMIQSYCTEVSQAWGVDYSSEYPLSNVQYLGAVIKNDGLVAANNVTIRFFVSDVSIGDEHIDRIDPGQFRLVDKRWEIPVNVIENSSFTIVADPDNEINEQNETDNTLTTAASFYYATAPSGTPQPGRAYDLREDAYGQFTNLGWLASPEEQQQVLDRYILPNFTPPILKFYSTLRALWIITQIGGHCDGMSATNIIYFKDPDLKPDGYPMSTFDMPKDSPVVAKIQEYQAKQVFEKLEFLLVRALPFTPGLSLDPFKDALRSYHQPQMLFFDSHSVTAYKYVNSGDNYIVPIYDPNDMLGPTRDQRIRDVNLVYNEANGNCLWGTTYLDYSYYLSHTDEFPLGFPYKGTTSVGHFECFTPRLTISDNFEEKLRNLLQLWARIEAQTHRIWLFMLSPVNSLTQDQFGRRIGFDNGGLINEIPGAEVDTVFGMEIYTLPDDEQYSSNIQGEEPGYFHLNMFIPQPDSCAKLVIFDSLFVTPSWRGSINYSGQTDTFKLDIDFDNDGVFDSIAYAASIDTICQAPSGCQYVPGDANGSNSFNGLDVTYGVSYFKGGPPPPLTCDCPPHGTWYVAGDVNASCSYNGLDVTYAVSYFKGGPPPHACGDCPPTGLLAPPIPRIEPAPAFQPIFTPILKIKPQTGGTQ